MCLPPLVVQVVAQHNRVAWAVSLVIGAILQGFIPPRRGLVPVVLAAVVLGLIYALFPLRFGQ
jgi:hypothetical protein